MKIGVLGSGVVGDTLSEGFLKHGYQVMRGSRDPKKFSDWLKKVGNKASAGTFLETCSDCDVLVLSVKGTAAESLVKECADKLANKLVLDATNPIADEAPNNGVLRYFTSQNESLMERLQKISPSANFVKCFNSVGSAFMVNPKFGSTKPTMFICGKDEKSKATTREILTAFGWETEDMGGPEAARAIEALCMLWCIPGFKNNQWAHAFKLLKP